MTRHAMPETPFLALDLEAFERNVAHLADTIVRQGGKRWRPHTKAIRSPVLAKRLIAAGASGVTCATVSEAETMVMAGIADVLIANQIVGHDHLQRLAALNRAARVIVTVDSPMHIKLLAAAAAEAGVVIPIVVEVDVGLGRAGVSSAVAALALAQIVRPNKHLKFCGVMAWEGQTTRIPEPQAKAVAIRDAVGFLIDAAQHCVAAGIAVEIVSCGGTGTYPVSSTIEGVTEIQAGGGVFGDVRYRTEFHMPLEPALKLFATVISRPTARRIVCDAGWKYHGCHPTLSQALGLPAVQKMAYAAEHLTLECEADISGFAVGERIGMAVGYADSTVFLHREMMAMRYGEIEEVLVLPAHP